MFFVTCTLLARAPAKVNENADVIIRINSGKVELGSFGMLVGKGIR